MTATITARVADYDNKSDALAVVELLDHYACDPMGGEEPLSAEVKSKLIAALAERPFAFSVLAFDGTTPVGLANVFEGFSTFACKPLVNIHDLVVHSQHRGKGVSHLLLEAVELEAKRRGCTKVTLEVLAGNTIACRSYEKFGFKPYMLDPAAGVAQFWQKSI